MILRLGVIVALALGVAACKPSYQTKYSYVSPKSDAGRDCVVRCTSRLSVCHHAADVKALEAYQRCDADADNEVEHCMTRTGSTSEKGRCYRPACGIAADYGPCGDEFRGCFTVCGGAVTAKQVCEANC